MNIIDYECLACSSFSECGTDIGKGSIMCSIRRSQNMQTKGEMLQKMCNIAKASTTKGADVMEILNIKE